MVYPVPFFPVFYSLAVLDWEWDCDVVIVEVEDLESLEVRELRGKGLVKAIVGEVEEVEGREGGERRKDGAGELIIGEGETGEEWEVSYVGGETPGRWRPRCGERRNLGTEGLESVDEDLVARVSQPFNDTGNNTSDSTQTSSSVAPNQNILSTPLSPVSSQICLTKIAPEFSPQKCSRHHNTTNIQVQRNNTQEKGLAWCMNAQPQRPGPSATQVKGFFRPIRPPGCQYNTQRARLVPCF
ncbi:uncharacterized protein HKW66_Vig0039710 [Vigna angularis]|uniref:Uncharacterized protein n=1 Tax=Phaseolus angularis TaxID=3914 RepID=A0A8T0LAL1_PHAAN|nr:uncharacterized protein HKW66_Vig0039710 [Vigna angularis]